jgi:UDP-N-acetylmuramate--alanine ligase
MENKKIHFMGVGGAGCSAVYFIAKSLGYEVSGCDKEISNFLRDEKGIQKGHDTSHLTGINTLVYSPAIPSLDPQNPELLAAKDKGIEAMPWERFVAREFLSNKFVIAISGTHGKSTTTAMTAAILEKAGLDPTCLVGAIVNSWGRNYRVGKSKYFVIEADEYGEKFLEFASDIAAIINIEFDHPEYFKNLGEVWAAFEKFVQRTKKDSILITGPSIGIQNPNGKTIKAEDINFNLKLIGEFNKTNAAIAATAAQQLGILDGTIKNALENFSGLARRFEFKGEQKGVAVFDDYAHHPTAVLETTKAIREKFPDKKIWLVFQPHLFTRTKALFDEFKEAFEKCPVDEIILVDIFGAREKDTGEISSSDLAKSIVGKNVKYIPDIEEAAMHLAKEVSAGNIVVSMGAGDIYKLSEILLRKLEGTG